MSLLMNLASNLINIMSVITSGFKLGKDPDEWDPSIDKTAGSGSQKLDNVAADNKKDFWLCC